MATWDEDSPRLRSNLEGVLREIRDSALRRELPSIESARRWQRNTMEGLEVPSAAFLGRFRGETGLENSRVGIGPTEGVSPTQVAKQLGEFEGRLQRSLSALDKLYQPGGDLDVDGLSAVIDVAAWAHSEWVRIHPFMNGNGRTARMWANAILMRYGLDPVVRLRPRPDGGYGLASAAAMHGDWQATAIVFRKMLLESLPGILECHE
jgi:hypothetical protein